MRSREHCLDDGSRRQPGRLPVKRWLAGALALLFCAARLSAQQGDKTGESQTPLVPPEKIPPAPVVPPSEAIKTFKLAPGFHIELVASEPLVHAPIQIAFDSDGRLWALEMRGFMKTPEGAGEFEKVADIVLLEDTDGDGRMDKRTVVLDGLVMPRSFALVAGGLLVAEPPKLWFYQLDNDGKASERVEVAGDYAAEDDPKLGLRANPEHSSNGLLWALDNWIYSANHTTRYRYVDGSWQHQPTAFRGQWGISQDDYGRLVYNSNSDQLRLDLVPSAYLSRNPNYRNAAGVNVQPIKDQSVWPIRVNPGVNRGYQLDQLRPDGTLATYTAACAPLVYRGDNFPPDCRGNVFLCEPAGNLIRRNVLSEWNGTITATNAYDRAEFLASTDERFRPVNLNNGPDGALYVVDMYHGIIQHRIYLTTYLRKQAESRGLDRETDLGRIYRVVADGRPLGPRPHLGRATSAELTKYLSHPNGWWRDMAQRLLVVRGDAAVAPTLREMAVAGPEALGRLHALWTLDGLGVLDETTLAAALSDADSKVRAAAIRLCDTLIKTSSKARLLPKLVALTGDPAPDVQLQLAFTLGEISDPDAHRAMLGIAAKSAGNLYVRDALLTGLGGRELETLQALSKDPAWSEKNYGRPAFLGGLAKCVLNEGKPERINELLELAAAQGTAGSWRTVALLDGLTGPAPVTNRGKAAPKPRPVRLAAEPPALALLAKSEDKVIQPRVEAVAALLTWPGKPGAEPEVVARPLTADEQARWEAGKALYSMTCTVCHQPHGNGQEGLAPPLVDSDWVLGPERRLIRIVLAGLHGPINVKGKTYQLDMPALGVFDDNQIAQALTYVRREWGHKANPVDPATVAAVRAETTKHIEAWTEPELLKIQ